MGDPGNDYIAGLAWKFGQDVMTKFEWVMVSGAKLACTVVVNVTTPGGGDTTNIDTLEFEVTCYGKPEIYAGSGSRRLNRRRQKKNVKKSRYYRKN